VLWWLLIALAGLAAAGGSAGGLEGGGAPGKPPKWKGFLPGGPKPRPGPAKPSGTDHGPVGVGPDVDAGKAALLKETAPSMFVAGGGVASESFALPPGRWRIEVHAVIPEIEGGLEFGAGKAKKTYGYRKGPPGTAPILAAAASAASAATKAIAAGAATALPPYAAAIKAAESVMSTVLGALPDLVAKSRVKKWVRWRGGKYGNKAERARMTAAVRNWLDPDPWVATHVKLEGRWHAEGNAPGTWPVLPNWPNPIAPAPSVTAEQINDGFLEVTVSTQPGTYAEEIRYDVYVQQLQE
jgi:hypothetical protein